MMKKLDKIRKGVVVLFLPSLCAGLGVFFSPHIQASASNAFFETDAQTVFEYGCVSPDWADYMQGVKILTKGEGDTVTFQTELILQDKTQNDALIQGLVLPQEIGTVDFHYLTVTLTDCENRDVFLKIRGAYSKWGDHASLWSVSTNDWKDSNLFYFMQTETGLVKSVKSGSVGGASLDSSFCGVSNTEKVSPFSISYDYENNAVYATTKNLGNVLVLDLDDEETLGSNLVWGGFTSGKVSLELSFTGIQTQACVMIESIGGYQLTDETLIDTNAPVIFVDESQWADSVPVGEIGVQYPVFDAIAMDEIEGALSCEINVYRTKNGENVCEYPISNGAFLPDEIGTYAIVYTARDSKNLESVRKIFVDVQEQVALPHIAFTGYGANPEEMEDCAFGESFVFQRMEISGGSGKIVADFSVLYNGEKVNDGYAFTPTEVGKYEIVWQASDCLGRKSVFRREFSVARSLAPVITVKDMPAYFQGGKVCNLNYATAKVFDGADIDGKEISYQTFLIVNGQERRVKGNFLMPQTQAQAKVVFKASYNGKETIVERAFEIVTPQKAVEYLQGNVQNMEYLDDTATFYVKENDNLDVITPLCNLLEINFAIIESNGLGIDVILKDSEDYSRQLTVSFCEGKKGFTKVVCGTQTATASGEFFYNTVRPCTFSISQDGGLKDYTLGTLFRISRYDDGRAFDTFLGRKVYVGMRFHGSGALKILSLNGQSFQNTATDRISPNLVVAGHVSDRAEKNEKVILPTAYASDVLDANAYVTVNVASPDGSFVLRGKNAALETAFNATQYGRYTVTYTAYDESGNTTKKVFFVTVEDKSKPIIYIQGKVSETYSLGKVLSLPSAKAYCLSGEVEVFVFVITPNGQVCLYGEGYTPTIRGKYTVRYYAKNSNDSYAMKDFIVEVA